MENTKVSGGIRICFKFGNRSRRELIYDGEFPNTSLFSRRSMFEDPRISSRIEENLLRRYQHLEKLISFYDQDIANITKYWSYGCWCFQMGDNPLRLGNGQPVDDLDRFERLYAFYLSTYFSPNAQMILKMIYLEHVRSKKSVIFALIKMRKKGEIKTATQMKRLINLTLNLIKSLTNQSSNAVSSNISRCRNW